MVARKVKITAEQPWPDLDLAQHSRSKARL